MFNLGIFISLLTLLLVLFTYGKKLLLRSFNNSASLYWKSYFKFLRLVRFCAPKNLTFSRIKLYTSNIWTHITLLNSEWTSESIPYPFTCYFNMYFILKVKVVRFVFHSTILKTYFSLVFRAFTTVLQKAFMHITRDNCFSNKDMELYVKWKQTQWEKLERGIYT